VVDPGHDTALYEAVAGSNIALVRLMLDHGADPDVRSPYSGQFPINLAARCSASVLNLLLERGATMDVRDAKGWTPLHHAADMWNAPAVQTLLRHRAPVNVVDQQNRTPLDCARNNARSAAPERQWVIDLLTSNGGKTAAQLNANTAAIDPAR
jgi:ankyrin repeat protein